MQKKALKKLDEFIKYDGNSLQSFIQFFELREILEALYYDIEEAFYQTPDLARNFEERLARLEERCHEHVLDKDTAGYKEPSKPHECKYKIKKIGDMLLGTCECGSGFSEVLADDKPSEPMAHYSKYGVEIGKPSECEPFKSVRVGECLHEDMKQYTDYSIPMKETCWYQCDKCGFTTKPTKKPSECGRDYIITKDYPFAKPDTISIPRSVAEKWVKQWVTEGCLCSLESVEKLGDAIKQALKQ